MATCRNFYLDRLKLPEYDDFDIVMVVDMDMRHGWDMRGIMHSFSLINNWDVCASNGIRDVDGHMFDCFAFRTDEFPEGLYNANTKKERLQYWEELIPILQSIRFRVGTDLIYVRSAFGGMALYKKRVIEGCNYRSINDDCEHVSFHEAMIKLHNARIVINPSQILRYCNKTPIVSGKAD
jgi:hypothetical protein